MDGRSPRAGRALEVLPRRAVRTLTFPRLLFGGGRWEGGVRAERFEDRSALAEEVVCVPSSPSLAHT